MKPMFKVLWLLLTAGFLACGFQLYRSQVKEQQQADLQYEKGVLAGTYQIKWRDSVVTFWLDPTHLYHQKVALDSGKTLDNYGVWRYVQGGGPDRGKALDKYENQAVVELQGVLDPTVARGLGIPYGKCDYRVSAASFRQHEVEDKSDMSYPPLGKARVTFQGQS